MLNAFTQPLQYRLVVWAALVATAITAAAQPAVTASPASAQAPAADASPTYLRDVQPIFLATCARCHNSRANLLPDWSDYKTAYANRVEIKRRVWDSWTGQYHKQEMPAGNSRESLTITEEQRAAVRDWVDSGAPLGVAPVVVKARTRTERIQNGAKIYSTLCAACHQANGQGIVGKYPPLAASDYLNANKTQAIRVALHGLQGEITVKGQKYNNSMPVFPLSDEDIANALTYIYDSFGNSGKEVTPDEVKELRAENFEAAPAAATKTNPSQFE